MMNLPLNQDGGGSLLFIQSKLLKGKFQLQNILKLFRYTDRVLGGMLVSELCFFCCNFSSLISILLLGTSLYISVF